MQNGEFFTCSGRRLTGAVHLTPITLFHLPHPMKQRPLLFFHFTDEETEAGKQKILMMILCQPTKRAACFHFVGAFLVTRSYFFVKAYLWLRKKSSSVLWAFLDFPSIHDFS